MLNTWVWCGVWSLALCKIHGLVCCWNVIHHQLWTFWGQCMCCWCGKVQQQWWVWFLLFCIRILIHAVNIHPGKPWGCWTHLSLLSRTGSLQQGVPRGASMWLALVVSVGAYFQSPCSTCIPWWHQGLTSPGMSFWSCPLVSPWSNPSQNVLLMHGSPLPWSVPPPVLHTPSMLLLILTVSP